MNNYFLVSTMETRSGSSLVSLAVFVLGATTCGFGCLFIFLPLINVGAMVLDICNPASQHHQARRITTS